MTTMTFRALPAPAVPFACRQHHPATTAALASLAWLFAAALVLAAHRIITPLSSACGAAAAILAIVATACAYTRFCARQGGVSHALAVGIAWLVLAIAVEIMMTTHLRQGWFSLIGTPDHPLLRTVDLFVWIFAPAIFARRG